VVGGLIARISSHGKRQVNAFGEMVALLCEQGRYEAAVRLQQLWNGLAELQEFSLLCALADPQRQVAVLQAELARRRQAEQTLKRREKELLDFVENAAEGRHRVGPDGTILWANRAELNLLGYRADEYIGRHIAEFHADAQAIAGILRRLQAGETVVDELSVLRCKDGSLRHVRITSNACFEDGRLRYTRCFTRNVTEQLQAQAERERLLAELEAASRAKDEFLAMLGHELRNPLSPIVTALHLMKLRGDTREADPVRLAQVVSNLLTNAARYTPTGGRVWLQAARDGGELVVRVRDNGIGICPRWTKRPRRRPRRLPDEASAVQARRRRGRRLAQRAQQFVHGRVLGRTVFAEGHGEQLVAGLCQRQVAAQRLLEAGWGGSLSKLHVVTPGLPARRAWRRPSRRRARSRAPRWRPPPARCRGAGGAPSPGSARAAGSARRTAARSRCRGDGVPPRW
jgi:PAS domain S-box-containing protein